MPWKMKRPRHRDSIRPDKVVLTIAVGLPTLWGRGAVSRRLPWANLVSGTHGLSIPIIVDHVHQ